MSYTTAQLTTILTNAQVGIAPTAAQALLLQAYATQNAAGTLSDAATLQNVLDFAEANTDVALATYEFFTGSVPSQAGLKYLVNSASTDASYNPNSLASAYYAGSTPGGPPAFNTENRFYNFAINLATGAGAGAANFAATYGAVSFTEAVNAAYEQIIGTSVVGVAQATAAKAAITGALSYFQSLAVSRANTVAGTAAYDVATKAIMVGYILEEALKSHIGVYSNAINAFDAVLGAGGTAAYGTDIVGAINTPANTVVNLTTGLDTVVGGAGNYTFNAVLNSTYSPVTQTAIQAPTLNAFDSITGGTAVNTLNITDYSDNTLGLGTFYTNVPATATIKNIQVLNIASNVGVLTPAGNGVEDFSSYGLTKLNVVSNGTTIVKGSDGTAIVVKDLASTYVETVGGATSSVTLAAGGAATVYGGKATTAATVTGANGGATIEDYNHSPVSVGGQVAIGGTSGVADTLTTVTLVKSGSANIVSDSLTSLSISGAASGSTATVTAAAGARTLSLTLNGNASSAVTDATATAVNVTEASATAKASSKAETFSFAAAKAVSIATDSAIGITSLTAGKDVALTLSGKGAITVDASGINALAAIDATAQTGVATVTLGGTTQTFTGGAGQDIVTINAGQTGTVTGGSATNNEIVLNGFGATTEAALTKVSNFSTLGIAGSTQGVFDMSKVSGYTGFDVQSQGGNVTFTNAKVGSTLSIESGSSAATVFQTSDSNGSSDVQTLNLGSVKSSGVTIGTVVLEDANFLGLGTVNIVSNAASSSTSNTITSLGDNNLSALNISGAAALNITATILDSSKSLAITNTTTSTQSSSLRVTDNALSTLSVGGSNATNVTTLIDSGKTLAITDTDTAAVTVALTTPNLTSLSLTNTVNTKAATFSAGTIVGAALTTLNLSGNAAISVTGDAYTKGVTVSGATDNAAVSFVSTGATVAGATDTVTLGNGDDTVTLGAGVAATKDPPATLAATHIVTLGTGSDTVTDNNLGISTITIAGNAKGVEVVHADTASSATITVSSALTATLSANAAAATVSITAADGTNTISANGAGDTVTIVSGNGNSTISATGAGDTGSITVGTGANTITLGTGSVSVALGAHTGVDTITVGAGGIGAALAASTFSAISGVKAGDHIIFGGDGAATGALINITAAQVNADVTVIANSGSSTQLGSWLQTAVDQIGTAHTAASFTFQGNTYLVETLTLHSVTGATVVELVGLHDQTTATITAGNLTLI